MEFIYIISIDGSIGGAFLSKISAWKKLEQQRLWDAENGFSQKKYKIISVPIGVSFYGLDMGDPIKIN